MSSNFITVLRARCLAAAAVSVAAVALGSAGSPAYAADAANGAPETPFLAENDQAMTRMMDGMSIKPSGDVDRDFTAMMIPHHQGAIDMAQAELRYGHNEQLRRIAQEIIVEQQQEIIAMRLAIGQPLPPSAPAPDQGQAPANAASVQPKSSTTMPMPMRMDQEMK
ncbi:hypothetical protein SBC1_65960 (plasmid) [Caballeronia sp. SBC1]|uniref:DUF305 domain-containing protein n=1 Tax=unclassified Caballeronia TaxID=2646786 RepID=UPI0013E193C4|nr:MULTISPECIES: DUF305 domain-containing protein [unclassified Caballeronia]QIE28492.1 hypothetical protein SBC2_65680 [Caballeronia sp. SBC2]QIN66549.1 hypothetical protein SBC1_65960 [Caballeronia sp. SBC1]